jgi:RimJ/RimL family protein N-acetyltransferase
LPHPYTEEGAADFINIARGSLPIEDFCIERDGIPVGSIGLKLFEDIYRHNIEIGYYIAEAYWGEGLATEAVRLFVDYILNTFEVVRIFANVFEHNMSSMRVLEKNGFQLEAVHKKSIIKNNIVLDEFVWVKYNQDFAVNKP